MGRIGCRLAARRWAKRVAGPAGAAAMRGFKFEATKLALLRDGMRRGLGTGPSEIHQTLEEEWRLLASIAAYREVFVGRDPATPPAHWDGIRYQVVFPDGAVRPVAAPEQPVMPVPVVLPPQAPAYGYPPPPYLGYR